MWEMTFWGCHINIYPSNKKFIILKIYKIVKSNSINVKFKYKRILYYLLFLDKQSASKNPVN